jgi:hypothetical protein
MRLGESRESPARRLTLYPHKEHTRRRIGNREIMQQELGANPAASNVQIERQNALAVISLDRAKALNAMNGEMRAEIADALPGWARDPIVYAMVLKSSNERAFCAGGDVREIIETYRRDPGEARRFFADEYTLDWALECFSKPAGGVDERRRDGLWRRIDGLPDPSRCRRKL